PRGACLGRCLPPLCNRLPGCIARWRTRREPLAQTIGTLSWGQPLLGYHLLEHSTKPGDTATRRARALRRGPRVAPLSRCPWAARLAPFYCTRRATSAPRCGRARRLLAG